MRGGLGRGGRGRGGRDLLLIHPLALRRLRLCEKESSRWHTLTYTLTTTNTNTAGTATDTVARSGGLVWLRGEGSWSVARLSPCSQLLKRRRRRGWALLLLPLRRRLSRLRRGLLGWIEILLALCTCNRT
jgi:hypothetical protein